MSKYLLDTNIYIYYLKGQYNLNTKIAEIVEDNCCISEITVAELKYGIENSKTAEAMRIIVEAFITKFIVIPIYNCLDVYAKEKSKLKQSGFLIDDFDILIGSTAIANNLIMVTKNTSHFERLDNIIIEDWTKV